MSYAGVYVCIVGLHALCNVHRQCTNYKVNRSRIKILGMQASSFYIQRYLDSNYSHYTLVHKASIINVIFVYCISVFALIVYK